LLVQVLYSQTKIYLDPPSTFQHELSGYLTGFVRPSVGLSHMNYVEYL